MAKRFTLFRLSGFDVRIDPSWILLASLVTWSLARGFFPRFQPGLPASTYWVMGIVGSIALFFSIVLHELSHSLVARRFGLPMKGITLFIFGGVAEMSEEPPSPKAELGMAAAGPLASLGIAALSWVAFAAGRTSGWPAPFVGVLGYLATVNAALLLFNLIPAFPLDGGRVLRAILWMRSGSLRSATRTASRAGSLFGAGLIALGIGSFFFDEIITGIWWCLIGLFLRNAASGSYQQVIVREALEGEPVRKFMIDNPITVPRSISIRELVEGYIYKYHFKLYPVMDGEKLIGCISTRRVHDVPREDWDRETVGSVAEECSDRNTVSPQMDAMKALARMNASGLSRLLVVEGEKLLGILSLKDLLKLLALKVELE